MTTPRQSRAVSHPVVKTILGRIISPPPALKALLEEVFAANDCNLDATRAALAEMQSENEAKHDAYERERARYEAKLKDPARLAIAANAKWWDDDREQRLAQARAKLDQCDAAIAEHHAFMEQADELMSGRETDHTAVEILRAQLAAVQAALALAEAKLASHDEALARVESAPATLEALTSARAKFVQICDRLSEQTNPHTDTIAPIGAAPEPPLTAHNHAYVSALLDAIDGLPTDA
jgi:chromosome segregation ATPase